MYLALVFLLALTSITVNGAALPNDVDLDWWKTAVFYQIYPRSFKDSDNDGIGDLKGIISKIDHFTATGVSAIWLSPIYESPQVDQGYDISNYTAINPDYGTMEEFRELVEEAHARGLKVILDYVPNHTSDKHQWFIDSENKVGKYTDYFVWLDAKTDENGQRIPPNNWVSNFKNSSWTWSEKRQQYYLHEFAPQQPDLNYRNPDVVQEMKDVLTFWMDNGVDGFRIDTIPHLVEDASFPDEPLSNDPNSNPWDYSYLQHIYTTDQPETYEMLYQWREHVDAYTKDHGTDQKILMTEAYTDLNKTMYYYGYPDGSRRGAHFTFNFFIIKNISQDSTAVDIANVANTWLDALNLDIYVPNWVLGNHDNHRIATRCGPANVDGFNMLMLMLPGVGVTYNGEEIGQENGEVSYEEGQDPSARDPKIFDAVSRDFERTPFQWDDSVNAGFNEGHKPWLPVSKKYNETNLQLQEVSESNSHYSVYWNTMSLRHMEAVRTGSTLVKALSTHTILVKRTDSYGFTYVLLFNYSDKEDTVSATGLVPEDNLVIVASVDSNRCASPFVDPESIVMDPHESFILIGEDDNNDSDYDFNDNDDSV